MSKLTLKQHRVIRELSQERMAEMLGVHINTYRNWEERPSNLTIGKAKKIANVLELSIDEINFN